MGTATDQDAGLVGPVTLVEALSAHARRTPGRRAVVLLGGDGEEALSLTFEQLERNALALAGALVARGLSGRRALLAYGHGPEFIVAIYACMYAGVVAVPIPVPRSGKDRASARFASCLADARPSAVLTTQALEASLARRIPDEGPRVPCVATDSLTREGASPTDLPTIDADTLAHVQYTSGSTSEPRGVVLSHRQIVANLRMIAESFEVDEATTMLSWLPLFHDMGLVGFLLEPLYVGASIVLLAPEAFADSPLAWLRAVDRHRAQICAAPSSAYERCVRRTTPDERAALDLSTWRVAINAAESVRAETIERFADAFACAGFRREAMRPSYGLAEATVLVSATGEEGPTIRAFDPAALARGDVVERAEGRQLAASGQACARSGVCIVDPESLARVGSDRLGEIWVRGEHVGLGYFGRDAASRDVFAARIAGEEPREWLRTGDLGFLREGHIFVAGRRKEIIIIAGENHYPHDLEGTAERAHPAVRALGVVAFGLDGEGGERLIIAAETRARLDTYDTLVEAIAHAVLREHGVRVHAVVLVAPGALPRTSSGKLRRSACADAYAEGLPGELRRASPSGESLEASAPQEPAPRTVLPDAEQGAGAREARSNAPAPPGVELLEQRVRLLAEWVFETDIASVEQTVRSVGGTSSQSMELLVAIENELGVRLPFAALDAATTLAALAALLGRSADATRWPHDRLVPIAVRGARTPLFCVHDTLGSLALAHAMAEVVRGERAVFGVCAGRPMRPGRAVDVAAAQIARVQPRGPYLLCGAGSGARLAVEVAGSLERQGRVVALIGRLAATPGRLSSVRARRPAELLRGIATTALLACRARRVCRARALDVERPIDLARALAGLDASRSRSTP